MISDFYLKINTKDYKITPEFSADFNRYNALVEVET